MSLNGHFPIGLSFQDTGDLIQCWFGFVFQAIGVSIEVNTIDPGPSELLQILHELLFDSSSPLRTPSDLTALFRSFPMASGSGCVAFVPPQTDESLPVGREHQDCRPACLIWLSAIVAPGDFCDAALQTSFEDPSPRVITSGYRCAFLSQVDVTKVRAVGPAHIRRRGMCQLGAGGAKVVQLDEIGRAVIVLDRQANPSPRHGGSDGELLIIHSFFQRYLRDLLIPIVLTGI